MTPTTFYKSSAHVYNGVDYGAIWMCDTCKSYCGCHPGTNKPLGRLANKTLRQLKRKLHDEYFDKLWRSKNMTRHAAYKWLSETLGIPKKYTHIGMFSETTCLRAIDECQKKWKSFYEHRNI